MNSFNNFLNSFGFRSLTEEQRRQRKRTAQSSVAESGVDTAADFAVPVTPVRRTLRCGGGPTAKRARFVADRKSSQPSFIDRARAFVFSSFTPTLLTVQSPPYQPPAAHYPRASPAQLSAPSYPYHLNGHSPTHHNRVSSNSASGRYKSRSTNNPRPLNHYQRSGNNSRTNTPPPFVDLTRSSSDQDMQETNYDDIEEVQVVDENGPSTANRFSQQTHSLYTTTSEVHENGNGHGSGGSPDIVITDPDMNNRLVTTVNTSHSETQPDDAQGDDAELQVIAEYPVHGQQASTSASTSTLMDESTQQCNKHNHTHLHRSNQSMNRSAVRRSLSSRHEHTPNNTVAGLDQSVPPGLRVSSINLAERDRYEELLRNITLHTAAGASGGSTLNVAAAGLGGRASCSKQSSNSSSPAVHNQHSFAHGLTPFSAECTSRYSNRRHNQSTAGSVQSNADWNEQRANETVALLDECLGTSRSRSALSRTPSTITLASSTDGEGDGRQSAQSSVTGNDEGGSLSYDARRVTDLTERYQQFDNAPDVIFMTNEEYQMSRRRRKTEAHELKFQLQLREQAREQQSKKTSEDLFFRGVFKDLSIHEHPRTIVKNEFPKLSAEQEEIVDKALNDGRLDEKLVEGYTYTITRKDIRTLIGTEWLNDEVINFYLQMLVARSQVPRAEPALPKVYAFTTFFFTNLRTKGYASVKRWTRKVDIFAHDLLLVPVHQHGVHWCMAMIDFRYKVIKYFDSMLGPDEQALSLLRKYLNEESMDKKKKAFDLQDWDMRLMKDIPRQKNGSDCGMFSCRFAEYESRDAPINFEQKHMPYLRRRQIYEIVTKKLMV